ncbi:MAG: hypothetical protein EU539_09520 [Promethearchaeota archaeon]|nr:MAG: hypothetical protein EU539_09520 [Candidatus Lokiarchaeota archaeon]
MACIIGGILMLIASIVGSAMAYRLIIDFVVQRYPQYRSSLEIFLTICIVIAAAGGISVIAGSVIAIKIIPIGKWIIGLGAGMGLIGFLSWLITGIISGSITGTVLQILIGLLTGPASYGIIGVFLTIWARRFIKRKKEKEEE